MRGLRNVWARIVVAVLVPILVCRVVGAAIGIVWTRRRTCSTFHRSLLRSGLTTDEADSLATQYNTRISFRELLNLRHRVGH
ncbi:hypothetical protein ACFLSW_03525 [Candidatus Bipolaricaulota bacterium]